MPIQPGGRIYRSNVRNDIQTRLGTFVDAQTSVGSILLKELLQNADDAGAIDLLIALDDRPAPEDTKGALAELLGPALVVANDGPFKDEHFDAILEVASGQKLSVLAATGRFGVGFTSVFLVGDVCALCSQRTLVLFDLTLRLIPSWASIEGKDASPHEDIWISTASPAGWQGRDQDRLIQHILATDAFATLSIECNNAKFIRGLKAPFGEEVSVFRIPFRSTEGAHRDPLYPERFETADARRRLFEEMKTEAGQSLVFLRSVERVTFVEISETGKSIPQTYSVSPWNSNAKSFFSCIGKEDRRCDPIFARRKVSHPGGAVATYLVGMSFDFSNIELLEIRENYTGLSKYVPEAEVALCVEGGSLAEEERWRVLLPLTKAGPSSALCHGGFFLDQARHDPTFKPGSSAGETAWNKAIIAQLTIPLLYKLIETAFRDKQCDTSTSIRLLHAMPKYSAKKPEDAGSLVEYFSSVFYAGKWSVRIADAQGALFELSKQAVYPDKSSAGMLVQEIDELLARYIKILPDRENQRNIRYVSKEVFQAIRDKFPNANWCRAAEKVDSSTILKVLADPSADHSRDSLNDLVRRLAVADNLPTIDSLENAHLFWADGQPVKFSCRSIYVLKSNAGSGGAFHEIVEVLGLKIEELVRVEPGIGAADSQIAGKLGIRNVYEPDDKILPLILSHVAPRENRHDRFDPQEFWDATPLFRQLLTDLVVQTPKRLDSMRLAWTVCSEGGSEVPALNQVVVVHLDKAEEDVQILWDSFLSKVCPRIHPLLMEFHAGIQTRLDERIKAFDHDDVPLVRTRRDEILKWLGELYWQRGNLQSQQQVITTLGEVISILEQGGDGLGADSLIRVCARYSFHSHEFNLLCCLPIHRTAKGNRIALGSPHPSMQDIMSRRNDVRRRFRLQPRDTVPPPPGASEEFVLLNPPGQVRSFYEQELGIQTHSSRLAVLDILRQMATEDMDDQDIHKQRLRYLAAKVPEAEGIGDEQARRELEEAKSAARLVPCIGGLRRFSDSIDASEAVEALRGQNWEDAAINRLVTQLALPKGLAQYTDQDERRCLQVLGSLPENLTVERLPILALQSQNPDLRLTDRVRVLASFHGRIPKDSPEPSAELREMPVPCLSGATFPLGQAELLPEKCFELTPTLVSKFFSRALDTNELARNCGIEEVVLRRDVLPLLRLHEMAFQTAAKRIREEFQRHWPELPVGDQRELLNLTESGEGTRWGFTGERLLAVAMHSLSGKVASGETVNLYHRLVELVCHLDRAEFEADALLEWIVFPCRDGQFHPGDYCWFTSDIGPEVRLATGAGHVVESSSEAKKLRLWMESGPALRWILEERFPARLTSPPDPAIGAEPVGVHAWHDLILLLQNPDSALHQKFQKINPELYFDWQLRLAERLSVQYTADNGKVLVLPEANWNGPPVVVEEGTLWIRTSEVPEISDSRRVTEFDQRIARELLLGIGMSRRRADFDELLQSLLSELDRPGDELERLGKRRSDRIIARYADQTADQEFAALYREWERLDPETAEWRQKQKKLEELARRGMVEACRKEMEELGYSIDSFFAEMAQNAEDACLQRGVLGMESPPQATLTFHRVRDDLWIEHFGRPFNYWRHGERSEAMFREDIERITSSRGSFKQQHEGPAVTGRFGVGFKCVYWLTDCPRIHSHIWHFEIESACIPKQVEAPPDLPEGVTRIVLPLRPERRGDPLPEVKKALDLILFTQAISTIAIHEREAAHTVSRSSTPLAGGNGEILEFTADQQPLARVFRLATAESYLAIELDLATGMPKRRDADAPDTFQTFPLSGERHHIGVAISAKFSLQSGRAHLAAALAAENERAMQGIGRLLAACAGALDEAATRPGVGSKLEWFKAFWLVWNFNESPDSALLPLAGHIATGLTGLCHTSDVAPRWDGALRSAGANNPIGAYDPKIPESFARALATALTEHDRVDSRVPASSRHAVDHDLAMQFEAIFKAAKSDSDAVRILGWQELAEFFCGESSMFGVRPNLINILAESLWNPTEKNWWNEEMRHEAAAALRSAWLPTAAGLLRPTAEIVHKKWFHEKGAPQYVLDGLHVLSELVGDVAQDLLAGAGLKTSLSWDEFRKFMDDCSSFEDAGQFLRFLSNAAFWKSWDSEKATILRDTTWVPREGKRLKLSDPLCAQLLDELSPEFLRWLNIVSNDQPSETAPPPPKWDPRKVLNAVCDWWQRDSARLIREYEAALYPDGMPAELCWQPGSDLERRRAWVTLFVLSMAQTLGWTTTGKQRRIAEKLIERGFMDVFADKDASGDAWIGVLDEYLLGRLDQTTGFKHWIQIFWRIRAMARPENLSVFVNCLEDATKPEAGRRPPRAFLCPRDSPIGQSREDVPDGAWALGIGASFLWRELCRKGMLSHPEFDRYCFVPKASVRRLVEKITVKRIVYIAGQCFEASCEISAVLQDILGRPETFERCYDIPLLLLSEDTQESKKLREVVFGKVAPDLVDFHSGEPDDPFGDVKERDGFWLPPPQDARSAKEFYTDGSGTVRPIT